MQDLNKTQMSRESATVSTDDCQVMKNIVGKERGRSRSKGLPESGAIYRGRCCMHNVCIVRPQRCDQESSAMSLDPTCDLDCPLSMGQDSAPSLYASLPFCPSLLEDPFDGPSLLFSPSEDWLTMTG